jgi:GT2 family glycosyltransferase
LQCLRGTLNELGLDYEIWLVDNGSTDRSMEIVQKFQSEDARVHLIPLPANQGTTLPRNLALKQCLGDWVLVLDSDAYVNATAIDCLMNELRQDARVGIVAPQLVFPDGRPQLSTDQFPTVGRKLQRLFRLRQLERASARQQSLLPKTSQPVDYAISAVWLMRRELLNTVGTLDENIFYAPEDADYCLRTWQTGYQVRYMPAATIVHDAQEKSRKLFPNYFTYLHVKGLLYYFLKHRYAFSVKRLRRRLGVVHEPEAAP